MQYSWTQFVIGAVAGTGAVGLLAFDADYVYATLVLLMLAPAFLVQAPEHVGTSREPFTSDMDEWRKLPSRLVRALPAFAADAVFAVLLVLGLQFVTKRLAWIDGVPWHVVGVLALAAWWSLQVVAAFREGRRRRSQAAV